MATMTASTTESAAQGAGWRLLRESIMQERAGILAGVGVAVAWTAGRVAIPLLVQLGIDRGIEAGGSLTLWAILILVAGALSSVALGLRRYIAFANARKIEARLRDRLFAHIQRLHTKGNVII